MGGSSKQTIGYKYFGGMMVVIGNRIEKLLNINADNRGWIIEDELPPNNGTIIIDKPNLFGGSNQEGGWIGLIDTHLGADDQEQNKYLARHIDEDVSAYPNLSYLVFRGADLDGMNYRENLDKGFELVSMSGMLKDFMLWVKRIHVKNNGSLQWHDQKSEVPERTVSTGGGTGLPELKTKWWSVKKDVETSLNPDIDNVQGYTATYDNPPLSSGDKIGLKTEFYFNSPVKGYITIRSSNDNSCKFNLSSGQYFEYLGVDPSDNSIDLYKVFLYGDIDINFSVLGEMPIESRAGVHLSATLHIERSKWRYEYNIEDINPIHKIREILTDYTAMNKPESSINDVNFMESANRVWEECLGISWCIQEKSCKEALDELLYHIEAGLRINRQTGLYEVILFRDDLINLDDSLLFNESNIKSIDFDIANLDESISSINVSYYDRELIKDSSFLLYENGLERTRGFSISENIDFPYFMKRNNAEIVGNWKLKQLCSPTWKGSFKTGIIEARKINKYDVVKLSWKSKGLIDLPVRILNINLGDGINNTVTLDFIEVIPYSNIDYTSTNIDPPIDENIPPQFNANIAFEMPYFEAVQRFTQTQVDLELSNSPELGYLMASAARPQNNSLNAHLYTDKATGVYTNMAKVGVVDYCPAVYLNGIIGFTDTIIKVSDLGFVTEFGVSRFNGATKGTWILLNNEVMVYESFNPELMEITVKRGALDTVPHKHNSGIIFFSDDFSGIDPNQYIDGETVQYQVLTTTPISISRLDLDNSKFSTFKSRAIKPYPPANVKINYLYYPETTIVSNDINITWVDRNRLQQTGGDIIGFFDGGITRESGVSYSIDISSENIILYAQEGILLNSHTIPSAVLIQNKPHKIRLWSKRDGFDSFQVFEHNIFVEAVSLILTATAYSDKVIGSTVPIANIDISVDESLTANMRFDGSSIKGKSLPNSSITIEVDE